MSGPQEVAAADLVHGVITQVVTVRTWGRRHNHAGPKPPTFRTVTVTAQLDQRYCSRCARWRPVADFRTRKICRDCRRDSEANPGQERVDRMRYRTSNQQARRRGATLEISFEEWVDILDRHERRCSLPGCDQPYEVMDHVIPLSHGGRHAPENMRPLCRTDHLHRTARDHRTRWGTTEVTPIADPAGGVGAATTGGG